MRNRELIMYLQALDPDAVVELNIDIYSSVGAEPGSRQDRRVVEVRRSHDGKCVVIEGCGSLRPNEEELLDNGHYNKTYTDYESHWNGLLHDRIARRRIMRDVAHLADAGIRYEHYVEHSWDELPLRVQQIIMVRLELPTRVGGAHVRQLQS